ncbi:SLOG family protein [Streptomyces sp. NPDC001843]|uniref:SLOG family protein n=1 Tax=Streptomyces sp. NPDC001843 TaxID=3364617 RepID=UPI0036AFECE5
MRGSTAWQHAGEVYEELTRLYLQHGPFVLVHGGGGTGVDAAAHHWARVAGRDLGCLEVRHPANFAEHGKRARPVRDKELVKAGADLALIFSLPGDEEAQQVVDLAKEEGIPVQEITT